MNTEATLLVGPGSNKSFEHLQIYREKLMTMRAEDTVLRKTSFKVFDYQFDGLITRVENLEKSALVGYGVDVESGEFFPFLFAAPNEAQSSIGCVDKSAKMKWFNSPN